MHLNPSAARSLEEGLEETLTLHKLRVPDQLRRTLSCTNVISKYIVRMGPYHQVTMSRSCALAVLLN
jgi:hypothetical protein